MFTSGWCNSHLLNFYNLSEVCDASCLSSENYGEGVEMLVDYVPRESRGNNQNTGSLDRPS